MQAVVGITIMVIVAIGSLFVGIVKADRAQGSPLEKIFVFIGYACACFIGTYISLAVVSGIIWIIAWVGIILRICAQWLAVAVLYPWHWIL